MQTCKEKENNFYILLFLFLVYDSVVTIPDYTLYVVTGVTTALAWPLPSNPIYPDDEFHRYELSENRRHDKSNESTSMTPTSLKPTAPTQIPIHWPDIDFNQTSIAHFWQLLQKHQSNYYRPMRFDHRISTTHQNDDMKNA